QWRAAGAAGLMEPHVAAEREREVGPERRIALLVIQQRRLQRERKLVQMVVAQAPCGDALPRGLEQPVVPLDLPRQAVKARSLKALALRIAPRLLHLLIHRPLP